MAIVLKRLRNNIREQLVRVNLDAEGVWQVPKGWRVINWVVSDGRIYALMYRWFRTRPRPDTGLPDFAGEDMMPVQDGNLVSCQDPE